MFWTAMPNMESGPEDSDCSQKVDKSIGPMVQQTNKSNMTKEDRKRVVLRFLVEHGLALPPLAIHRNLKFHQGITFGRASVDNYLEEFVEDGYVRRVDPEKLGERELVDIPGGRENRAYYIATDSGRRYLRG
jgi:hypothetical protein